MLRLLSCFSALCGAALLCLAPPSVSAAVLQLLPEDTDILVAINDVTELQDQGTSNSFVKAWNHPAIQEWTAPLREKFNWEKLNEEMADETGGTRFDEVIALIDGGMAIGFHGFDFETMEQWGDRPEFTLLVEFGENADAAREIFDRDLENDDPDETRTERENYGDAEIVEVTHIETDEESGETQEESMYWTVHDGLFALSLHRERVLAALDARRRGGADAPFDQGRHYASINSRAGDPDLLFYLNGRSIAKAIMAGVEAQAADQPPNPMGISPTSILPALGVDRWELLYFAARLEEQESFTHMGLLHNGDPTGLWNLFPAAASHFDEPSWVPAGWHSVTSVNFDLLNFFDVLEGTLGQISPMVVGMWQGIQMQTEQNTGINLRTGLINTFGAGIVAGQFVPGDPGIDFARIPPGEQAQLLAIKLRDAETLRATINTALQGPLQGMSQMMEVRDYLGHDLMVFNLPNPLLGDLQAEHAVCITDDYLLLSLYSAGPLEQVLQNLADGSKGNFWDRADVREALADIPGDATAFARQDTAAMIFHLVETLKFLAEAPPPPEMFDEEGEEVEPPPNPAADFARMLDMSAAPGLALLRELFGPSYSYNLFDEEGVHAVTHTLHVE